MKRHATADESRRRGDRGSITVEMVLLAPLCFVFFCFVIGLGRLDEAHGKLVGAARDAARAASDTRSPTDAVTTAANTARANLASSGMSCRDVAVHVDTSQFKPGGVVNVAVTCTTDLSDVTVSGLPGAKTLTAVASAPLDTYRGATT
jgi:Flp pilus assembly protein TadG